MAQINAHHGILKDVDLHVDDTGGPGRPVVLIHGWPLSGESWKYQVPALEDAGYRVITYDRRGFGRSDKPTTGYGYDTLASDLEAVLSGLDVTDVTLVGFSMGGGEVARYVTEYGTDRIRSVVFASAVPPYLLHTPTNPAGPLSAVEAAKMTAALSAGRESFFDDFLTNFFSAHGSVVVPESDRQDAIELAAQASKVAALEAMASFANTDFRADLTRVTVPTLIIHGDADAVVPFEGSGARTHAAIRGSELHVIPGGPHGVNVSHTAEWNRVVIEFLGR